MTNERAELIRMISELSEEDGELRFGQLIANLSTLAYGPKVEAVWDVEDGALLAAADRLLARYRERKETVAPLEPQLA